MPLTDEQIAARRQGIGASDVAALLGEDRYRSRHDVWAEKVYGVAPLSSEAAELGNYLESGAIRLGADKIGLEAIVTDLLREVEGTMMRPNLDAYVIEDDMEIPLEAKAVGIMNPMGVDEEWGDEWSADIPSQYAIQITVQMMAVGAPYGYLSAVIGGRGHRVYKIPFDPELAEMIKEECAIFWESVESETPPDGWEPSGETLSRILRIKGEIIAGDSEMAQRVIAWKNAKKDEKQAKEIADRAKDAVIALLGDAEGASMEGLDTETIKILAKALGTTPEKACLQTAVKYFEESRSGIDRDILKRKYPDAYKACQKTSTTRVLRLTKPPKGFTITNG